MSSYVFASWSGFAGPTVQLTKGEPWAADDPFVAEHPDWFDDEPPVVRRTTTESYTEATADSAKPGRAPAVEQATAAPGEKRAVDPGTKTGTTRGKRGAKGA